MTNEYVIENLKKSSLPIYLWGCGNVANEVYELLNQNNIMIDGVFVDVPIDNFMFKNYKVVSLNELLKMGEKINVIIGHAQYHRKRELDSLSIVNEIFYFSNPFKTHEEITEDYYIQKKQLFDAAKQLYMEPYSRKVFDAFLDSKLTGNIDSICAIFNKPMDYFDNDIWTLSEEEVYVDVGAYIGDTLDDFITSTKRKYKSIYAFEPDEVFFEKLEDSVNFAQLNNVNLYKKGLWNMNTTLTFEKDEEQSGKVVQKSNESTSIEVVCLDDIILEEKVSLIKINMSGSLKECIEGMRSTIEKNHPKLAITLGLTRERMFQIPLLLKEINPDYQFFLRFNESMPSRVCLYVKEK